MNDTTTISGRSPVDNRRIWFFYLGCILLNIGANTAHPVTPTIFTTLGLGSYMFGVALASQLCTNFLFSPFWGWFSSYISSGRTLFITCVGYALGQILFGLSTTEWHFIVARGLTGIFCGGVFVCIMTYVVNTAPDQTSRGQRLTMTATIQMVCSAFGYFLGGILGEIFPHLAIIVQVILLTLSGILFYVVCQDDARYTLHDLKNVKSKAEFNPFHSFLLARNFLTPVFAIVFAVCLFRELGFTSFDQTFNYYIRDQFGFSSGYNGVLKGIMGLITLAANSTFCLWLVRRTKLRRSIIVVLALCSASMLGVILMEDIPLFVLAFIFFLAFNSISLPLLQTLVANDGDETQSNLIMGFFNAIKALGGIIGALSAGLLYTASPKLPFILGFTAFVLATGLAFLYNRLYRRRKKY